MLNWKSPDTGDRKAYQETVRGKDILGSDMSFANVFLLQKKYDTKIAFCQGFLFKKYFGSGARRGYTFPIGEGNVKKALELIASEAGELGERFRLAFVTEEEKAWLEENYPGRFEFTGDSGDSDYIYLREDLANLRGRKYSRTANAKVGTRNGLFLHMPLRSPCTRQTAARVAPHPGQYRCRSA